jgi:hypothetical protein
MPRSLTKGNKNIGRLAFSVFLFLILSTSNRIHTCDEREEATRNPSLSEWLFCIFSLRKRLLFYEDRAYLRTKKEEF